VIGDDNQWFILGNIVPPVYFQTGKKRENALHTKSTDIKKPRHTPPLSLFADLKLIIKEQPEEGKYSKLF